MIIVNRIDNNIVVSCRNNEYNVMYSEETFEELMKISEDSLKVTTLDELNSLLEKVEGICKDDFKQTIESFHPNIFVNPVTKEFFFKVDDIVHEIAIPEILVERLKKSIDQKVSIDPIMKLWIRFLKNPKVFNDIDGSSKDFVKRFAEYISMTYVDPKKVNEYLEQGLSEEIAEEKATTYEVKITQEGLIACYKTSNEVDYKFEEDEDGDIVKVPRYKTSRTFDPDTGEILEEGDERDSMKAEDRLFEPYMMGQRGDAFYCEGPKSNGKPGHFIRIGHVHRLPDWSYVNTNDTTSCVKGLTCSPFF